jgi:hypothetical protein
MVVAICGIILLTATVYACCVASARAERLAQSEMEEIYGEK